MSAASSSSTFQDQFTEGNHIKVIYQNTTVTGLVWTYEEEAGLLVLQVISGQGDVEVVIIDISQITSVSQGASTKKTPTLMKLDPVDVTLARRSEDKKVMAEKTRASGINRNVTKEAQALFNRLNRLNIPCQWDNQDILIAGSNVRIQPPYAAENCISTTDAKNTALDRIQKVVSNKK